MTVDYPLLHACLSCDIIIETQQPPEKNTIYIADYCNECQALDEDRDID